MFIHQSCIDVKAMLEKTAPMDDEREDNGEINDAESPVSYLYL
ncbi:MAG: hypothetical protein ACUVXJ_13155 [Phycisphaerae bacterium]